MFKMDWGVTLLAKLIKLNILGLVKRVNGEKFILKWQLIDTRWERGLT